MIVNKIMLKMFLICDSQGFPFYSRVFDVNDKQVDNILLSGLISAIGMVGKEIFKEELATISFGENKIQNHIIIISKTLLSEEKAIYFVFFTQDECNKSMFRQLSTSIFIEAKQYFKGNISVQSDIKDKIDKIIDTKFDGLKSCNINR